jgi:hypothetical protein
VDRIGGRNLTSEPDRGRHTFEIDAYSAQAALATVVELMRPIYGSNWWADVTPLDDRQPLSKPYARMQAEWN